MMDRRNFVKNISIISASSVMTRDRFDLQGSSRRYWVDTLLKICSPVITAVSQDKLREVMPVEARKGASGERYTVTHLEAFARSLAGLAPWLELEGGNADESSSRERMLELCHRALSNAVSPTASDRMNFVDGAQPLVDAAFLAHALLRAPVKLWGAISATTQGRLIESLKSTRKIKPYESNWLLFSAMIEAALLRFTGAYEHSVIEYGMRRHEEWYKGDGIYGDGQEFHADYYNSFVIQPMLVDIVLTLKAQERTVSQFDSVVKRATRYAEIQERLIAPDGSFPPLGRSLAYRCGAFQHLAQMALQHMLPASISPAQVRSALSAVIRRTMDAPETFDKNGWLTIGLCGHQPDIGETYISTGSLYLCSTAFLPLGLPEGDEFWASPEESWTSKKAFAGQKFPIDKALKEE